jgi:hypothetical protein
MGKTIFEGNGYYTAQGYMGWTGRRYELFTSFEEYVEYMES